MARLVVKKTPWWVSHKKEVMVWLPLATLQAGTLAGLGYFYHRLTDLEQQEKETSAALADSPAPVAGLASSTMSLNIPAKADTMMPKPMAVPLQVEYAAASPGALSLMRVGQDFSALPTVAAKPEPKPVSKSKRTEASKERSTQKPVAAAVAVETADPTAEANLSALPPSPEFEVSVVDTAASQDATVSTDPEIIPHRTAPVGISKWVYLGELRDYGWHGQKLRLPPDSGLPEEGGTYQTQQIHGLYDEPHGRRVMGGFQLGDTVAVQKVRHEASGGVWAEVRKVRSVGKPGCVTCTQ